MKVWQIVGDGGIDALELAERPSPEPAPGQVRIRVRANSINYRDLSTVRAPGQRGFSFPRIPNSDGAGEVAAVGAGVSGIAAGDRVAGCFFQSWAAGGISAAVMASAQGGALDGMLAEEVVLNAGGVVPVPAHLDYADAATLPLRRAHRVERVGGEGRPQGGRNGAVARHRRRFDIRAAILRSHGRAGDRHLEERRQTGPRPRHGRMADDQLYRDAGLVLRGEGFYRRCRRGPCRRSRRRRDAGAIHRSGPDRRPYRHDRRADPGRGRSDGRSCANRSA